MNAMELGDMKDRRNNDEKDLARLGKHPVLKVCHPACLPASVENCSMSKNDGSGTLALCPSWASAAPYSSRGKAF